MRLLVLFLSAVSLWAQAQQQMLLAPKISAAGITAVNTGDAMCVGATGGTINFDSTGANTIVIGGGSHTAGPLAVSDNKSNTYTALVTSGTGSAPALYSFYAKNATTGAGHVITITGLFPGACAATFAGVSTSTPLQSQTNNGDHSGATNSPGSQTPSSDGSLIITFVSLDIGTVISSIDAGFTISGKLPGVPATSYGSGLAYLIQGTAGIVTPTWTFSSSVLSDANIAVAK